MFGRLSFCKFSTWCHIHDHLFYKHFPSSLTVHNIIIIILIIQWMHYILILLITNPIHIHKNKNAKFCSAGNSEKSSRKHFHTYGSYSVMVGKIRYLSQVTCVILRNCRVDFPQNAARQNVDFLQPTADRSKASRGLPLDRSNYFVQAVERIRYSFDA